VKDLRKSGIQCTVQELGYPYKVYCGEFTQKSDANTLKRKLSSLGYKGAFTVSKVIPPRQEALHIPMKQSASREVIPPPREERRERPPEPFQEKVTKPREIKDVSISKEETIKPENKMERKDMTVAPKKAATTDMNVVQEKVTEPAAQEGISGDIFERKGGLLHPFLSLEEYYTDNIFNTEEDEKNDYVTIISPGIWISLPRLKQKLIEIETSTLSPGGFTYTRMGPEFFRRYQTYLLYRADMEQFSKYSSENMINQTAEGIFHYNFRSGLSIEFADHFERSHDIRGTGISKELDKYRSNLITAMLTYNASDKFNVRADYSYFIVNYEAGRNDFRDRFDNSYSAYLFYKFLPKKAAFIEYSYINVKYDDPILSNSEEHLCFGGLQWDITAKSRGMIKAGLGVKNFMNSDIGNYKDFILEIQIDHDFSPRTSLHMTASRKTNETNIPTTDYILSHSLGLEYRQRLSSKISGSLRFFYESDTYEGNLTFAGETGQRDDNYLGIGLALRYELTKWLTFDAGYLYNMRESSFSEFDYKNNTVFIRTSGIL
jgi:hypothetical protein